MILPLSSVALGSTSKLCKFLLSPDGSSSDTSDRARQKHFVTQFSKCTTESLHDGSTNVGQHPTFFYTNSAFLPQDTVTTKLLKEVTHIVCHSLSKAEFFIFGRSQMFPLISSFCAKPLSYLQTCIIKHMQN